MKTLDKVVGFQGQVFYITPKEAPEKLELIQKSALWAFVTIHRTTAEDSLSEKVKSFLAHNPHSIATLIADGSKGTQVVRETLVQLSEHKEKINVITLGADKPIQDNMGKRVFNFVPDTLFPSSQGLNPPGMHYLANPTVQLAINQLAHPTFYSLSPTQPKNL